MTQTQFETEKYTILRSVIERPLADLLAGYAYRYAAQNSVSFDKQVPGAPAAYGTPMMDKLLEKLLPVVEAACGFLLSPTYSYLRVYARGDVLRRHKDRPACEISLTLCLGYKAPAPWPILVEGTSGVSSAMLEPGDGLLYKGTECPHWREPFDGDAAAQVFLHYVDRNGPNAAWRFDKRSALGFSAMRAGEASVCR